MKSLSKVSRPTGPGGYNCPCCTPGPRRSWKQRDRQIVRRHARAAWEHEEFVEEQTELDEFAEAIMEQVHGEHPMEDEIDRALGFYPGTSVEVSASEPIRTRIPVSDV